jgi:phospholipid transport system substrate-binding protein
MTAAVAVVFLVALMLAPLAHAADRTGGELVSAAASLSPLALVKSSTARVLAIGHSQPAGVTVGDERRTEIRRVAQSLFDFGESGRRALGSHWNGHSPAEQGEFIRLFTDMLKQFCLTAIDRGAGDNVTFQDEKVNGRYAQVRARVTTTRGTATSLEYRLLEGSTRWAVYDVVVDGASLVSNYRSQFDAIIRTSSFTQFLDRLRSARSTDAPPRLIDPPSLPDHMAVDALLGAILYRRTR